MVIPLVSALRSRIEPGLFVCVECGYVFQYPERFVEKHGLDTPPYEQFTGCPKCGGAYVKSKPCDCCGEVITNDYVKTEDGCYYCDDCYTLRNVSEDGDLI